MKYGISVSLRSTDTPRKRCARFLVAQTVLLSPVLANDPSVLVTRTGSSGDEAGCVCTGARRPRGVAYPPPWTGLGSAAQRRQQITYVLNSSDF